MNDSLFSPKWKDMVFNEGDLLPIYIYRKGTWENLYYFNKELPSKDNNDNDEKIKNNKKDKENKENIPNNEPLKALTNNKNI